MREERRGETCGGNHLTHKCGWRSTCSPSKAGSQWCLPVSSLPSLPYPQPQPLFNAPFHLLLLGTHLLVITLMAGRKLKCPLPTVFAFSLLSLKEREINSQCASQSPWPAQRRRGFLSLVFLPLRSHSQASCLLPCPPAGLGKPTNCPS